MEPDALSVTGSMSRQPRQIWISYLLSASLHAGLVTLLIVSTIPAEWQHEVAIDTEHADASVDLPDVDSVDLSEGIEDSNVHDLPDALSEFDDQQDGMAAQVRQQFEAARESAESKTLEEQASDLEALGRQLTNISSEESVGQIAETLAPILGLNTDRATKPDEDADDSEPFDPMTAQVSDVLRTEEDGSMSYIAIMVDAAGRSQETPLNQADGEALYEVFQLMKKFPLLETVYRKTVMGLLDQLMEEERRSLSASPDQSDRPDDEESAGSEESDQPQE